MTGWTIQKALLAWEDRGVLVQAKVDALVCGELAVHQRALSDTAQRLGVWDVTHLPTSSNVCSAGKLQDALDAAELLLGADIDWPDRIPDTQAQRDDLFECVCRALDGLQSRGGVWIVRANGEAWQTPPETALGDAGEALRLKRELDILASAANLLLGISSGEPHSTECDHCGTRYSSDYTWYPLCPNCYQVSRPWLAARGVEVEDNVIQNAIRAFVERAR